MGWQVILGIIVGIGGIILSIFACTWIGIVMGIVAIGLGQAGKSENQSGATAAMGLGVAAIVISLLWWLIIGAILLSTF